MAENRADSAAALVDRAQRGDSGAFDELVRRYRDRIVALALHMTGSSSEADDIAQDVFLKAFTHLHQFQGRSHFFTWVYRMAINRSLTVRRDRSRRRIVDPDDPRVTRAIAIDAPDNPARAAELRDTYSLLLAEVDRLPAAMCTTVVLVVLQGLSHGEAAVVQDCSPGTIAWRIHEARARLRKALDSAMRHPERRRRRLSPELTSLLADWVIPSPA